MTETTDCAVIGAGVVGLAVARALARRGREVVVLEAAQSIGTGISARNSEVIHAGIYYPRDSLKAQTCVAGKRMLYAFCASHGVAHQRIGKLVVATEESQVAALRDLGPRARANGVDDLEWLDAAALARLEPALRARAAWLSPSTGIVDSHGLMLALQGDAEAAGAVIARASPVTGGRVGDGDPVLAIGGAGAMNLACRAVVNCAGLGAPDVARSLAGLAPETVPRLYPVKGNYFTLSGRAPFSQLIYPLPDGAWLGVHLTLDLAGQAKFGPDQQPVETLDFAVDPGRAEAFYASIRRFWPDLEDGRLHPGYAGIRPRIQAPGAAPADFVIQGADDHGAPGLVNLYGIESPGLTSSLAIAEAVAGMLA